MSSEFGRGVLVEGPQPPEAPVAPDRDPRPVRHSPPRTVPLRTPRTNAYSSLAFTVVKIAVVVTFLGGVLIGLAAMNRLPDGVQDTVADTGDDFGLHLPHSDDTFLDRLPVTTGPGSGVSVGGPTVGPPVTAFDPGDLNVDPGTFDVPEVQVPVTPPPVPTAP